MPRRGWRRLTASFPLLCGNTKGFALSLPKRNRRPRVAVATRPLARARATIPLFPPPLILAGRQAAWPQARGFQPKGMGDLLLMYRAVGAETRDDYLREVANENGLPFDCVRRLADRLGEREDFGLLICICEER